MLYPDKRLPRWTGAGDIRLIAKRARRSPRIHFSALQVVGVLVCGAASTAHPQAVAERPPGLPEMLVETQQAPLRQRVAAFIKGVTRSPEGSDAESLVRWNAPICFLAVGLPKQDAKALVARLAQIASAADAPLAREPCQANFIILATSDPNRVISAWYERNSHIFGDSSLAQIDRFFRGSTRPVRVWRNIDRGRVATMRRGHFAPSNLHADSSPLARNTILGFSSVFAVFDTDQAGDLKLNQIADYVAMAGLSNCDLGADLAGTGSILQLLAASKETPPGLSSWDAAFLKALYQSDQTSRGQRFEIADRMTKELLR